MKYLKVWTSFLDIINTLDYDEIGRLFEMMLNYADHGEEPEDFNGNERFLWPVAKQQIDLAYSENVKQRENGKKGGRPKTKDNPTKPTITQEIPTEAYKVKERNIKECNVKEPLISDAEGQEIQREQNLVLEAAKNAGFNSSPMCCQRIVELYAKYGMEKTIEAINECVKYGVTNIAYLAAVLRGEPKKKKPQVSAQDYEQRDYSHVQEDIMAGYAERIKRMKAEEGGE